MSMVIRISFSAKVGRKMIAYVIIWKLAEEGENDFANRYTHSDDESKKEYLKMRPVLNTDGQITLFNTIGCYVTWQSNQHRINKYVPWLK